MKRPVVVNGKFDEKRPRPRSSEQALTKAFRFRTGAQPGLKASASITVVPIIVLTEIR